MITLSREAGWDYSGSAYRDLFSNSDATGFQHPLWMSALYDELRPAKHGEPLTIAGRDDATGELILVLPLIRRRILGMVIVEYADFGVTDYCCAIIRRGYQRQITECTGLQTQLFDLIGHCDLFRIKAARPEHASVLSAVVGSQPLSGGVCAHELAFKTPFEVWRKGQFSKRQRYNIDSARRRLEKLNGVHFERVCDSHKAIEAITELRALRQGRFKDDPIAEDAVSAFYMSVARRGTAEGFSLSHRLNQDGRPVGISFGIAYNGRFHGILTGCDYERFGRYSPGLLVYDGIMAELASSGFKVFDFNVGDASYKDRFGTTAIPVASFHSTMTIPGYLADSAITARKRLRSLAGTRPRNSRPAPKPKAAKPPVHT